jgi:predicted alpha-1,6-mannanase (GH76 family)
MDKRQLAGIISYVEEIKTRNFGNVFPQEFEKDMKWLVTACEMLMTEVQNESSVSESDLQETNGGSQSS